MNCSRGIQNRIERKRIFPRESILKKERKKKLKKKEGSTISEGGILRPASPEKGRTLLGIDGSEVPR